MTPRREECLLVTKVSEFASSKFGDRGCRSRPSGHLPQGANEGRMAGGIGGEPQGGTLEEEWHEEEE